MKPQVITAALSAPPDSSSRSSPMSIQAISCCTH